MRKMKNKSRIISYFLVILSISFVALAGCKEDFFKEQAADRITPDQHYQSIIDANVSLQGAIVYLQDVMPNLIMLDGLRSDMMNVTDNATSDLVEIDNQIFSKGNPYLDPADFYKVIINVNEVLANIDLISARDRAFNENTSSQYKGALIGLRAWTYLTLVRLYNKAVWFEGDTLNPNLFKLPTDLSQYLNDGKYVLGKQEILSKLIEEVTQYIHGAGGGQELEELRIPHYMNTKALLGELYLETGNFTQAAYYLKLACESYGNTPEGLKVDETYENLAWKNIFFNSESQEVENISVIPFSREEAQFNPLAYLFGKDYGYMVKPSMVLIDSFMAQTTAIGAKGDLYRGIGITFDVDTVGWINDSTSITEPYITKYAVDKTDPLGTDIIISRAADIHLMLAEAYNRMGDETSQKYALMLLNQGVNFESPKPAPFIKWSGNLGIRGRAYLESRMVPEIDSIAPEDRITMIEDDIIAERALELAFEGKRWFDLVRIAERRGDPAYLADRVAAKFQDDPAKYAEIHAKLMNPANWFLPFE